MPETARWKLEDLKLPPHLVDTEVTRQYFRELLAEVRLFDDQVGKAEELLKKLGLAENTVIIVLDEKERELAWRKIQDPPLHYEFDDGCVMKWPDRL